MPSFGLHSIHFPASFCVFTTELLKEHASFMQEFKKYIDLTCRQLLLLLNGCIVSARALPPNVLRLNKQHDSKSRSRPLMMTPLPSKPKQILSNIKAPKGKLSGFSLLFLFFSFSWNRWREFWFWSVCTVVVCQSFGLTNCCLLQLHAWGGVAKCHCLPHCVSVDQAWSCPMRVLLTYSSQTVAHGPTGVPRKIPKKFLRKDEVRKTGWMGLISRWKTLLYLTVQCCVFQAATGFVLL